MNNFADNLAQLPSIDHLNALLIKNSAGEAVDRIENVTGKQGSLKLYHALHKEFGELNAAAAQKGLELFAEHVADAEENPGKHPNIDRLFAIVKSDVALGLELVEK